MDSQGLHQAPPLGQVQGAVSVRYRGRSRLRDVAAEGIRERHGSVHGIQNMKSKMQARFTSGAAQLHKVAPGNE